MAEPLEISERAVDAAAAALHRSVDPMTPTLGEKDAATREAYRSEAQGCLAVAARIIVAAELRRLSIELGALSREVRQDADAVATGRAVGLGDAAGVLRLRADALDPEGADRG